MLEYVSVLYVFLLLSLSPCSSLTSHSSIQLKLVVVVNCSTHHHPTTPKSMDPKFARKPIAAPYSGLDDLDRMPDTPTRRSHHRRAHSETFFRFPDEDILLDEVVADFDLASLDIPSLSSDADTNAAAMAVDSSISDDKSKPTSVGPSPLHFRSLSVGADFFEGLEFASGDGGKPPAGGQQHRYYHRHSNSMDGSTSFEAEESSEMLMDGMKKAMGPDRLAELALLDPKRAKRILANRQSAARSKERKIRYTNELERKVHTLQSEATTLSAQVTMLQRDTTGLTTENKELKLRLQALEQQAHLRDALNETLREEVQRLKLANCQIPAANENSFSRGLPPQFPSQQQMFQHFNNHQAQQQVHQQQLRVSQSTTNNHNRSAQPQPGFLDFN